MSLYGYKKKYGKALWKQIEERLNPSLESKESGGKVTFTETRRTYISKSCKSSKRVQEKPGLHFQSVPKIRKSLRGMSAKRSIVLRLYRILREGFLGANSKRADIHHKRGKSGALMLDWRFWMAVTRREHEWIGAHPKEAREHGYICQVGEWNTPPQDQRSEELKEIMQLAMIDFAGAKQKLILLAEANGMAVPSK